MSFASFLVATAIAAASATSVGYVPPVDEPAAAVVDGFRPPSTRYGAGNRGIDYDTEPGDAVRAAAAGVVVYAGRIGTAAHVVVLHDDGIRTSYSYLHRTAVRRGDRVDQGDVVGTAGDTALHFGARVGDEYLDPTVLLAGGGPPEVRLVPADQRSPLAVWEERRNLVDHLAGAVAGVTGTVARGGRAMATSAGRLVATYGWEPARRAMDLAARQWERMDEAYRAWGHVAWAPVTHEDRVARRMERVIEDQRDCTPAATPAPSRPAAGRIAVLVAGLNSTGGGGAVLDVDTSALGYADGMVTQFSYAAEGGQAPNGPERTIAGIPVHDYDRGDTHGDLGEAGARLRALLADINRLHPGVPVDLIAHSQGGLVVRAGLTGADRWAPELPVIANVVTLGTPHHGAHAATAAGLLAVAPGVGLAMDVAEAGLGDRGVATGTSTVQLSAASRFLDALAQRGLPAGTVTSIAASGDLVVDAQMSAIDDATNVVVHLEGDLHAHDRLPGAPATQRELALALGGLGPTCAAPADLAADLTLADTINLVNGIGWVADRAMRALAPVHSLPASGGTGPPD